MPDLPEKILGFGIDLCDTERIYNLVKKHDDETLSYLFSQDEYTACINSPNPADSFSSFFALKEAFGKAIGTGLAEMPWTDIEVNIHNDFSLNLKGKALCLVKNLKVDNIIVKIEKKKKKFVLATVILEGF